MDDLRKEFPIFKKQKQLIYLDSAATSLKPKTVIQAINDYNQKYSINSHSESSSPLFKKVWTTIQETREIIAQKIKGKVEEISFLPSTTHALNILALSLKNHLQKGDRICLTYLEHSSNLHPWQAIAKEKKAIVDFLPLNKEFTIDISKLDKYIDKKTKIVSFVHVSNSLGVINPAAEITKKIKEINPECLVILDACQSVIHVPINVAEWNIDALALSGHKVYGPTGIGVLWIKKELGEKLPHLLWGGGKKIGPMEEIADQNLPLSQKMEVGTLPLAEIFGLKAAFEFLNNFATKEIYKYENDLRNYTLQKLKKIKNITIYNQKLVSANIITFNLASYHAHDIVDYLGKNNILIRAGNLCCPYLNKLIGANSALRISFGAYNNYNDINELVSHLQKIIQSPQVLLPF
ncbi:aminotransferase class V-fold PLP-dependent enzyme [endosymbiont GvMRE of Glomus versiforme]|uniref:aminotransferase class V-fold PLP-dependent enzyme n=1 Tax=endosymbiont GvMRE of Glomus versiforme TaxID=2039283 RepID=UPI000EE6274C|nr:aminotransferase class V-fold PLP-dependent enzyme [endosymbiont GvMRE of Glomus versiforme]RHZ37634.1 Cysteine desulfurase [endosymbiont GvMRE of Glomus versiforme]